MTIREDLIKRYIHLTTQLPANYKQVIDEIKDDIQLNNLENFCNNKNISLYFIYLELPILEAQLKLY
jgi:hypothetical protein